MTDPDFTAAAEAIRELFPAAAALAAWRAWHERNGVAA
jgi:hypothetical protein